jgi:hypothetical protein
MHDSIYLLIFVVGVALPPVYFAVVWRRRHKVAMVSVVLYLFSYLPLTLSGDYTVANHGGNDWRREWLPKFLMIEYRAPSGRTKAGITLEGAFYWPLLLIDHIVWHQTTTADV